MPPSRYVRGSVPPEVERGPVPLIVPETPRSLKLVRALLLVMAVMLAVNTRGRLGVVHHYGVSPGISPVVGTGILADVGSTFLLACVGAFFLLGGAVQASPVDHPSASVAENYQHHLGHY